MSTTRRALSTALGAFTLASAWWLGYWASARWQPPEPLDTAAMADIAMEDWPAVARRNPFPRSGMLDAAPPPMPLADAPLSAAWPALLERAETGDRAASCRLALGLAHCASLHGSVDRITACDGIDDALTERSPELLLRAARGSDDPHAWLALLEGGGLGRRYLFADGGRRLVREHSVWAIERLIAQGQPQGLMYLIELRRRGAEGMDGHLFRVAVATRHDLFGEPRFYTDQLLVHMSPEARAIATPEVATLRERYGSALQGSEPPRDPMIFRGPELTPGLLAAYCASASEVAG